MPIKAVKELSAGLAKLGQQRLARQDKRADYACSISWAASFGRGVRLSPVSTRNTGEPSRGSLMTRILDPARVAATWKIGLKGGFGFMASM